MAGIGFVDGSHVGRIRRNRMKNLRGAPCSGYATRPDFTPAILFRWSKPVAK